MAEPPAKKSKSHNQKEACIFCGLSFTHKSPAVTPNISKVENLLAACKARKDESGGKIIEAYQAGTLQDEIRYHRDCRATYTSKEHVQRALNTEITGKSSSVFTRSKKDTVEFKWKENCFICSEPCSDKHRSQWSLVASTSSKDSCNIYKAVLTAAEQKSDDQMLARLHGVTNGDLVATDARYHRGKKACFIRYTSRNTVAAMSTKTEDTTDVFKEALEELFEMYYTKIVEEKEVFLMKTLTNSYQSILSRIGATNTSYTAQHLKRQLLQNWENISIFSQKGLNDIIVCSAVTVGDVLRKMQALHDHFTENDLTEEKDTTQDEVAVVYEAAGILQRRINEATKKTDEYFAPHEAWGDGKKKFVDPLLYKAIGWITNRDLYDNATDIGDGPPDEKCLNIACDITTSATSVFSPKHLALSISLYHSFGSRTLIEQMHMMGYGISYYELRRFLTSAAEFIRSFQPPFRSGAYIPPELKHKEDGGKQIIAVADNWDHNDHTIDGKRTTHSMTSIYVSSAAVDQQQETVRIPRLNMTSLQENPVEGGRLSDVLPYSKPTVRPEPKFDPPATYDELSADYQVPSFQQSANVEILYQLLRSGILCSKGSSMPWGAFHVHIARGFTPAPASSVCFNPILMAPPTNFDTIFTLLKRSKEAVNCLGFPYVPVFFDMGLLTKALEIVWASPTELQGVIPCEGGMHLLMAVFAGIGYLYGDAGLQHLLYESGVYAHGTAQHILTGKDFDRALRAFRLIDEVLHQVFLKKFAEWCEEKGKEIKTETKEAVEKIMQALEKDDNNAHTVVDGNISTITENMKHLLNEFRAEGRAASPLFQLWDDFLQRVMLPVKIFISATRNGDWKAYHAAKNHMLPLLFASNRTTYARYMPVIQMAMNRLPQDIQAAFEDGMFTSRLTESIFNSVWMDYTLEATENKALKGNGGIIGLTLKDRALERWFLVRSVSAKYTSFAEHKEATTSHLTSPSVKRQWNADVRKMVAMFDSVFTNPFDIESVPSQLVNFATGVVATKEVEASLLNALNKGEEMLHQFVADRLILSHDGNMKKSFYSPVNRSKVKTMTDMNKSISIQGRKVRVNGEGMYLRLMAINATKNVPVQRVMSFENSPTPLSLFREDGTMHGAEKKAEFRHKLEELIPGPKILQVKSDAVIHDGHAVIRCLLHHSPNATFEDKVKKFVSYVMEHSEKAKQIHVVFDRYEDDSTKGATRQKRGNSSHTYIVSADKRVPPNYQTFLESSDNKANLAKFYTKYMCEHIQSTISEEKEIWISGGAGDNTMKITRGSVTVDERLKSNMEEADGRIIYHATVAASRGARTITVRSEDTDVLVLLVHHFQHIGCEQLFMQCGRNDVRYIPVVEIYNALNPLERNIVLPVYCLSGCDTVSTFYGIGKIKAFKALRKEAENLQELAALGTTLELTQEQKKACTQLIATLYGRPDCTSMNDIRAQKATSTINIASKKLPPTDDALHLHMQRALYQLVIWRNATVGMHDLPDATQHGFERTGTVLRPKMMSQTPAAPELMNELFCTCPSNGCYINCCCLTNQQPCTAACSCSDDSNSTCNNFYTFEANSDFVDF